LGAGGHGTLSADAHEPFKILLRSYLAKISWKFLLKLVFGILGSIAQFAMWRAASLALSSGL